MKNEGFKTFTAIMIGVVTIVSAIAAWRAAVASTEAGQADFTGLAAAINGEEAQVLNTISVKEHYQAFLAYTRYNELGNKASDEIKAITNSSDSRLPALERLKGDAWGIAFGLQTLFFPSRYLKPDGTYDSQREMDEANAEAERQRDIKPAIHFVEADNLRLKSNLLIATLIFMGISLWLFTCAQIIEHNIKYVLATGGMLFLAAGIFAVGAIEIFM